MDPQDEKWYYGTTQRLQCRNRSCTSENAQTGILFSPPPMSSFFIELIRNMFRDCSEEDASGTVLIDINPGVSMHEGNYGNDRLEVDRFN